MENKYTLLKIVYDIVKDDPHPLLYHCNIREVLLRLPGNWQPDHLDHLAQEQYIQVKHSSSTVLLLTEKGLLKAQEENDRVAVANDN